eukprot:gnl/MRDRNA2_/MRDRNA2_96738_c0_seq1.p1 gnl/MRDRNA2_/MRDRNA2_96738_c0~~gnl/MRDRNA2_/MRDRNA2_96738_c0_seq1.p1  ORF type:complete len:241 (-),score=52.56 gnl/MRDRNA2_/MRDRNA2_96738_c0_seq1:137-778(-)
MARGLTLALALWGPVFTMGGRHAPLLDEAGKASFLEVGQPGKTHPEGPPLHLAACQSLPASMTGGKPVIVKSNKFADLDITAGCQNATIPADDPNGWMTEHGNASSGSLHMGGYLKFYVGDELKGKYELWGPEFTMQSVKATPRHYIVAAPDTEHPGIVIGLFRSCAEAHMKKIKAVMNAPECKDYKLPKAAASPQQGAVLFIGLVSFLLQFA